MEFTAAVFNDRRPSNIQVCLAWLVPPFVNVAGFFEFLDEFEKRCFAITDAPAGHAGESDGIAIVVHAELLIALNCARAASQTEQSNGSERDPDYGAETKPSFHRIKPPRDCATRRVGERAGPSVNVR